MEDKLTKDQVSEALTTIDSLCREEYGESNQYGLRELLSEPDEELSAARLQRLCGIILKRKFAKPLEIGTAHSDTKANRRWEWQRDSLDEEKLQQSQEFWVLDQLRESLPTLVDYRQSTWDDFLEEAEHERGVYKVLTLWIQDKWKGRESKSIRDYLAQEESPTFATVLDIADYVSQAGLSMALFPIIPVASVVVPLSIIGAKYGYRMITEAREHRDVDN